MIADDGKGKWIVFPARAVITVVNSKILCIQYFFPWLLIHKRICKLSKGELISLFMPRSTVQIAFLTLNRWNTLAIKVVIWALLRILIGRKKEAKCLLHNQSSLCKFFYLTCIIISIELLGLRFLNKPPLGTIFVST